MIERVLAGLVVVPFLLGAAAAPTGHAEVLFRLQDDDIIEASALVVVDGLVVTSNDSGDTGRVFAVDPATGDTVGVTHWEDDPTDVESLAPGSDPHSVWVGDIGDNFGDRSTVQVAEVPVGRGDRTVHPTVYELVYPDGAHDAETLLHDPATDRLYVATKDVLGGALYAVPTRLSADGVNRLVRVGPVLPVATDGTFLPDGKHLVIRNYEAAALYDFPDLHRLATFGLPIEPQGEGLGVEADGTTLLLDSEGRHSAVLRFAMPRRARSSLGPPSPTSPPPSAPPSESALPAPSATSAKAHPDTTIDHPVWPWAVAGVVLVAALGVIVRTRRSR